jgi:hypothetical protein
MTQFSVVVFRRNAIGGRDELFLATKDPLVVRMVRDAITKGLKNNSKHTQIIRPDGRPHQ